MPLSHCNSYRKNILGAGLPLLPPASRCHVPLRFLRSCLRRWDPQVAESQAMALCYGRYRSHLTESLIHRERDVPPRPKALGIPASYLSCTGCSDCLRRCTHARFRRSFSLHKKVAARDTLWSFFSLPARIHRSFITTLIQPPLVYVFLHLSLKFLT